FLSGSFARSVRESGATVFRELSLITPISGVEPRRERTTKAQQLELFDVDTGALRLSTDTAIPITLWLKTAIDLLVVRDDGSIDIIDYKRSPSPGLKPAISSHHRFQLTTYSLAVRHHFRPRRLRAGLVFLLSEPPE